jgi:hypothetical protein
MTAHIIVECASAIQAQIRMAQAFSAVCIAEDTAKAIGPALAKR